VIEQRRSKRFELELPLEIVRAGTERISQVVRTSNISSGGVLFHSPRQLEIGHPIEYVVTLTSGASGLVTLRCMGKVLRAETAYDLNPDNSLFSVAVSLERYEFLRSNGHAA
jgi:hypothetical protein